MRRTAFWFLLPALLLTVLVTFFPLAYGLVLGLMRKMPVFGISEFVGWQNFLFLSRDPRFVQSLLTTLRFTLLSVPLELVLGLLLALLLRSGGPLNPLLKACLMIPWAIPTVVSARMWQWIYNPEFGLLGYLLGLRGQVDWLGDAQWTFWAIVLADVWKTTPFAALLLYAGLQVIPEELYEAARLDGAGALRRLWYITLPLLLPLLFIVAIFRTMDAFRVFDLIYVLTGGGPANVSETLSVYAYKLLFQTLQFGYGSAVSVVMFLTIALLSGLYILVLHRKFKLLN